MAEYTLKDVIIDPEDPRLEGAIGKEVFASFRPDVCKDCANYNYEDGKATLVKVDANKSDPFVCINGTAWPCIVIVKEDPKSEYIPFESADEFLNAYENSKYNVINVTTEKKLINCGGIWLKSKCEAIWITQCIEVAANGIVLGLSHEFKFWKELLDGYRFLDGTPCGKLKESKK